MRRLQNYLLTPEELSRALRMYLESLGVDAPRDLAVTAVYQDLRSDGSINIQAESRSFRPCAPAMHAFTATTHSLESEQWEELRRLAISWAGKRTN